MAERQRNFEQTRKYWLVKLITDAEWQGMFAYPTIDDYFRGGEVQSIQMKPISPAEFESYREMEVFPVLDYADVRGGRI